MRQSAQRIWFFLSLLFLANITSGSVNKSLQSLQKCGGGGCGLTPNCSNGSCGGGGLNIGCCPQEPIKCCDPSCPKCLGGDAPRPGSGCLTGCPLAGCCPGTCPCDDCVCCYTTKVFQTVTSPCLAEVKSFVTSTTTRTKTEIINLTLTTTSPVTFSVDEIFLFTTTIQITEFARSPSIIFETLSTRSVVSQSTIYLITSSVTELRTTRIITPPVTVTTNPEATTTLFVSEFPSVVDVETEIITTFTSVDTTFVTGSLVTSFFDFIYTTEQVLAFPVTTLITANITMVPSTVLIPVPPITSDFIQAGTTTAVAIVSARTEFYGTDAFTTVPGTFTFYQYGELDATKTLFSTRPGKTSTVRTLSEVVTATLSVTQTENICPTRTVDVSSTTTIFVLSEEFVTATVRSGTSTAISTIASTIVFD